MRKRIFREYVRRLYGIIIAPLRKEGYHYGYARV